ncbi:MULTISPECIES: hypothetical protein [Xanthomonas]|uniref:Uncharacterized protein n=1 Tax=Xanthomonas cucurbitae TaxID=56453 RepID=A0ABY7YJ73_9XANT|nr:hypothetical protein [Xanthomonas cucurbitae]QHG87868.1 hypothetical protein EBN15_13925 [Xanthomonas cucurbitae]WDM69804.1 hypothetical protein K6981_14600 [Xanthomonas cucurbitae]WDM73677.1 hypothetical protein K6978_14570 [Xanthomonas cucurbitae]WDM77400.1 hypothetical protein K6982_13895 [Xanthomonas cucurbitae]
MHSQSVQARDADGDPIYRQNPHPKQAYRITMTIENAPGPFGSVSGTAFYDMTNRDECAPFDPALGMSTKPKEDGIPMDFQRVGDNTYVAIVYSDGMLDADYYGKGICRWDFGGVGVSLKATGKRGETDFMPSLDKKDFFASKTVDTFFWAGGYPKEDVADYPDTGLPSIQAFKEELRDELFKVTLCSIKESP